MRVKTQTLTQIVADPNGFTVSDTDVTGPFPIALPLDGALSSVNEWSGSREVDISANVLGQLITFTAGATGSTADVTITGRDQYGNAQTEVVTMPGASGAVNSTKVFSFIESMMIDDAYTNLEVGTVATTDQYGPWVAWDINCQDGFNTTISVDEVTTDAVFSLEHTTQFDLLRSGMDVPSSDIFVDANMSGASVSTTVNNTTPVVASRIVLDSTSTTSALRAKFLQAG